MLLGAHESVAGGLDKVFERGVADGCEAVQVFTRSSRRWETPPLKADEVTAFAAARAAHPTVQQVLAHCTYLINLATADEALRQKSCQALGAELDRCAALGIPHVVLHPGALAPGEALEVGLERVATALDELLAARPTSPVVICLENTAGQGGSVGHRFEHLRGILERMSASARVGVCFDTAHAFAAGYELRDAAGYRATWQAFADQLGYGRLRALHLNDSIKGLGCRVDRHAHIGEGALGLECFRLLLHDPQLATLPAVLETPVDHAQTTPYREELARLRGLLQR